MYICDECGALSERLGKKREYHHEMPSMPYEEHTYCPSCGEWDTMEEAEYCHECGEPISSSTSYTGDDLRPRCERCYYGEDSEDGEINIESILKRRKVEYGDALRIDGRALEFAGAH